MMNGLALDIDDTLCDTARVCMQVMAQTFGTRAPFDADQFLETYGQPGIVPDWQETPAQRHIESLLGNDEFMYELPPIEAALTFVPLIHQIIPVSLYITSRLKARARVSERWLQRHGFPPAPIILRDPETTNPDWKNNYLADYYPEIFALIDNEIHHPPGHRFKGHLLEVSPHTWPDIKEFLEKNQPDKFVEKNH